MTSILTAEIQSSVNRLKELDSNSEEFLKSASYLCALYEALFTCSGDAKVNVCIDEVFLLEIALCVKNRFLFTFFSIL